MDEQNLIEVDRVSHYYGKHCAVRDVCFTVQRGEILGLLGPNGAGKSTTMQIICGVQTASQGRVNVANHDIFDEAIFAKQCLGFLPETPPLYQELTVDEYLRYTARLRRVPRNKISVAIDSSKRRCGLGDAGRRMIRNLSKGYQQRVGIAQAIIHSPDVVILDEPTSGLDPIQNREIRTLIRDLGTDHSVILSTHILPEVQMICSRVLIMNQGKLMLDKPLNEIGQQQYNYLNLAFETPPSIADLRSIDIVTDVEQLDEQHFRVGFTGEGSIHEEICQASLERGWGLTMMTPQIYSLEEIFIQLTQKDPATEEGTP